MAYKPDKHGRDHCPGGEDPIPCLSVRQFRALRYLTDLSATSIGATATLADWDTWRNGDPTIYVPRKTGGGADPVEGTDLVRTIRLMVPGRYTFTIGFHFTDVINGCKIGYSDGDGVFSRTDNFFGGPTHTYADEGYVAWTFSRIYPIIDPFDTEWPDFTTGNFVTALFDVAAIETTNPNIDEMYLDIGWEPVYFPPPPA